MWDTGGLLCGWGNEEDERRSAADVWDCVAECGAIGGGGVEWSDSWGDGAMLDIFVSASFVAGGAGACGLAAENAAGGARVFVADDGDVVAEYGVCVNFC